MGNAAERQKLAEEYPTVYGNVSCEQYDDDFILVNVTPGLLSAPDTALRREGARSRTASVVSSSSSLDSGYDDINLKDVQAVSDEALGDEEDAAEESVPCKTDRDLGEHTSHFGFRFYKYSDEDSEGNIHIKDADL